MHTGHYHRVADMMKLPTLLLFSNLLLLHVISSLCFTVMTPEYKLYMDLLQASCKVGTRQQQKIHIEKTCMPESSLVELISSHR